MTLDDAPVFDFPAWPQFDRTERTGLLRALEQGQWWRTTGNEVVTFEDEFARHHGAAHALAVTTGTHALELVLEVLGAGPGSEVIVPAFTFISSSQAAQRLGAAAVPVDVDPETYCIDPAAVEEAITPRTKVIMPVHMAGQVADMDALGKLSGEAGIPLLQDAAHAHGALWRGRPMGALGSIAAFSFQNGKLMTAGEGGAVLFPDDDHYEEAFVRHTCGRPRDDRGYFHTMSGSNFRMNEFSAAVLRAQLGRLEEQNTVRAERWRVLAEQLAHVPGVVPQASDGRCDRNPRYMAMFRVPGISAARRAAVVDALIERGIPAFVGFRAIYRTDAYWSAATPDMTLQALAERCPNADALSQDCFWLHHRLLLGSEEQMHGVAEALADVLARVPAAV